MNNIYLDILSASEELSDALPNPALIGAVCFDTCSGHLFARVILNGSYIADDDIIPVCYTAEPMSPADICEAISRLSFLAKEIPGLFAWATMDYNS